jgi:hypothetical protein
VKIIDITNLTLLQKSDEINHMGVLVENYMIKLSKETAEWHYKKLLAIHNFEYLSLAQKVSIFFQDLEHDILRKITEKQEFFDQWNWLKNHQLVIKDHGNETGFIPPTLVSDIHSFKPWRNEAVHKESPSIDIVTYLKLFQTMAQTIYLFSKVQWTVEINNIINNHLNINNNNSSISSTKKSKTEKNNKLKKNKAISIINKKLSLNLNDKNSAYSSINALVTQWSFNISNTKFENDYYIILEDQDDKILYCFYLPKGTITEPKKIFNQRDEKENEVKNRKPVKNKSIIIIPKNDKSLTNNWQGNEFRFIKYKILEMKY